MKLAIIFAVVAIVSGSVTADVGLSDWESVEELKTFLEEDNTDSKVYLVPKKVGNAWVFDLTMNYDCEDRAFHLRDVAESKGKRLSVELLYHTEYFRWYGRVSKYRYHAINKAFIGNEVRFVDPETDRIWKVANLD